MRKSFWTILTGAIALACLGASAGIARADTVTLDVSGILSPVVPITACSVSGCTMGGTLVIDNTTNNVLSGDVTISGESPTVGPFTSFEGGQAFGLTSVGMQDLGGDFLFLFFPTATPGSLVGYLGGPLDTHTLVLGPIPPGETLFQLSSGSLTLVSVTATPEPSPLLLFAAGLLGALALGLLRTR